MQSLEKSSKEILPPPKNEPVLNGQEKTEKEKTPLFELVENKKIMEKTFLENQNVKPEVIENRKKELENLEKEIIKEKEKLKQAKIKEAIGGDHHYVALLETREKLNQEIRETTDKRKKREKETILKQTEEDIKKIESEAIEDILLKTLGEKSSFGILKKETDRLKTLSEKTGKREDKIAWEKKLLQKEYVREADFEWLLLQENKERVLNDRLKVAREEYARTDYVKEEKFRKIKSILGVFLKTKPEDLSESQIKRKEYEEAAKNLTTAKLEGIKRRYMGSDINKEEMGIEIRELLSEMSLKEKLNLLDTRTEIVKEKWKVRDGDGKKERWKKNIYHTGEGLIKWYRSLSPKQRMGISVILLTSGLGAGAIGATSLAAMIGATKLSWRIFSSVNTGVGLTALQKNIREKRDAEKAKKETDVILKEIQERSWDEKFDHLKAYLEGKIDNYEKDFQRAKRKNISRKIIGFGSAAAMFFVPTMIREHFFSGTNVQDFVNDDTEKYQHRLAWTKSHKTVLDSYNSAEHHGNGSLENGNNLNQKNGTEEIISEKEGEKIIQPDKSLEENLSGQKNGTEEIISEKEGEKIIQSSKDILIPKGSSIEKALIKQYMEAGKDLKSAQGEAHRDVLDWIKEHPELGNEEEALAKMKLVQPGTKIIFDEKSGKILGFEDVKGKPLFSGRLGVKTDDFSEQRNVKEHSQIVEDAKKEIENSKQETQPPEAEHIHPNNETKGFSEEQKNDSPNAVENKPADEHPKEFISVEKALAQIAPNENDWKISEDFLSSHYQALAELKIFDKENPFYESVMEKTLSPFLNDLFLDVNVKADLYNMQRFVISNQNSRFGMFIEDF